MIKVAVLGYGTVGSGVVQVIQDNNALISERLGEDIEVKYILDLRDFPGDKNEKLVVHDASVIMDDPEVSVVCETMGGATYAYEYTKAALNKGKSVCTSNKELVERYGPELISLARKNGANYLFEASVGGGIPIIRPMNTSLAPECIEHIQGILNGTTNYILTAMSNDGSGYEESLKKAQELGYAELNPAADVEGHDAGRKIAILASLMTGKTVAYEDIDIEGITAITETDLAFAKRLDRKVKLIARADRNPADGTITAVVAPHMLGADHPLATVNDVFNAILVTGNMLGEAMFYGKGAGKLATASAVVSDVIELARAVKDKITLPCVWSSERVVLGDVSDVKSRFFVRIKEGKDVSLPGAEEIAVIDGWKGYLTEEMTGRELKDALSALGDDAKMIRLG